MKLTMSEFNCFMVGNNATIAGFMFGLLILFGVGPLRSRFKHTGCLKTYLLITNKHNAYKLLSRTHIIIIHKTEY